MFREGDDSLASRPHAHIRARERGHIDSAGKSEKGREPEGGEGGESHDCNGGCAVAEEGRVICEPEPATLPPVLPSRDGGGLSISHCYAARTGRGSSLPLPEPLTLSITHFHFIICPLHPLALVESATSSSRSPSDDTSLATRRIENASWEASPARETRSIVSSMRVSEIKSCSLFLRREVANRIRIRL